MNKTLQLRVFRRDGWLCYLCGRPVVFAPAMRLLQESLRHRGYTAPLAYFEERYSRDRAPLLDHLAAVIDHKTPRARGGTNDEANLMTACNKCNMRKNDGAPKEARRPIRTERGEPKHWDGFSALFTLLADQDRLVLTPSEREWLRALKAL